MIATEINLAPDQWDGKSERVSHHHRRAFLQRMIENLRRVAEDVSMEYADKGLLYSVTAQELRNAISARLRGEERPADDTPTLLTQFAVFTGNKTNPHTKGIYANTMKMIERTTGDIGLDKINRQWLTALDAALTRQGIKTNTRAIHFRNIRAVINDAIDNELTTNYPFRRFSIKHEETEHRALDAEELRRIFALDEWHADMFRLSFLLIGMNAADIFTLTEKNIDHGRIVYRRTKTGRLISVKLEPEAFSIIERNRGMRTLLNIADRYSNVHNFTQAMSKFLRRHHPTCTMYHARHSWATIAFSIGVPMDTISRALGHSFSTGAAVTAVYVKAGTADIDAANRSVIDYVEKKAPQARVIAM